MTTLAVSKIRLDSDGRVAKVFWSIVDPSSNEQVGVEVLAPVCDVVAALHAGDAVLAIFDAHTPARLQKRRFTVLNRGGGAESVGLEGPVVPLQELCDMPKLDR
jgi:hypothetical protein